jgi:hypothetical protein
LERPLQTLARHSKDRSDKKEELMKPQPAALKRAFLTTVFLLGCFTTANAAPVYWTDWTTGSFINGFTGQGVITTGTSTVNVTYSNLNGIGFYQPSGGIDYWVNSAGIRDAATSPYTSALVDNIPTGTDIIALRYAGTQTLTFSEMIANPVFSYVSLNGNGNGYGFLNQDFDILSYNDPATGNSCAYWGCGTSYKNVVDLGGGNFEYQLLGTGEPHGTIRFKGAFDTVVWKSLSNEYWNGFTVGVQGTAAEVFDVPEPSSMIQLASGLLAVGILTVTTRRRAIRATNR